MSGTLFVVATPIGNLEDVTLRALRVLRQASVIAAEDTRRTAKLLTHHGVATPSLSFHQHNTRTRIPQLIARLKAGESIALVTDAGTPGVSDPGVELVQSCIDQGIAVEPIPGVSAPLTAAVGAGFPLIPLTIYGFAPSRPKDRISWLREIASVPHTFTFFETPHRISLTLLDMASILVDRPIVVARELTKVHQEFVRGTAAALAPRFEGARGEFTVVVGPAAKAASTEESASEQEIVHKFRHMTEVEGFSRRAAVSAVAKSAGRRARDIYDVIERSKKYG